GSDGPPTCYDDVELADLILVIGSNMAEAHPVTFDRIRAAKQANPDLKLVVIDPRRTATAAAADLHVPVAPGGDVALMNAVGKLHLLTGQIGKPGAGPFSLTGQPNAMGGREAGLLSHQLPGYRTVEDAGHRAEVERSWNCRPGKISPKVGLTAVEMFRSLEK